MSSHTNGASAPECASSDALTWATAHTPFHGAPLLSSPVSWSVVAGGPTGPQEAPRSPQRSVCASRQTARRPDVPDPYLHLVLQHRYFLHV